MSIASHRMTRQLSQSAALTPSRALWPLLAVCVVGLWPTVVSLTRIWRDMFDYHHGPLIAIIAIVWLWRIRRDIDACSVRPVRAALPLGAVALLTWAIAYRANSELMQQALLPVIPILFVYAALGPKVCWRLVPPIAFLYFGIPVWELLLPYLQWLTTNVAESVLGLMAVPTHVEGHHVTIPEGHFSIVEGCSGKRYIVTGLAFAALAAAIEGLHWRRTLVLLSISTGLALVTNWIRVVTVIYAGHATQMQSYLVAHEHKSFGYALFIPQLLVLLWVARRVRRGQADEPAAQVPEVERRSRPADLVIAMVLAALPILVWARAPREQPAPHLAPMPIATGAWQGPLPAAAAWQPRFLNPADERRAAYAMNRQRIELYLNVYGVQTQGHELVFHRNSIAPGDRYILIRKLPARAAMPPAQIVTEANGTRWVVTQVYEVGGWLTASPAMAQLYYGLHAIVRPVPAGTLALAARCEADCDVAERAIDGLWREHSGELVALIPDRLREAN
ncbi:MAG TPA: EpsI family protein [Steroidobacteraceae bacterium]|jgi:EpsI family protein|nr:EpsI family protein [Steroidobacteraceae bacterium]